MVDVREHHGSDRRAWAAAWTAESLWSALLVRVARRLEIGHLHLRLPNGARYTISGASDGPRAALTVRHARAIRKLLTGGEVAFAEAYMDGDCDTPDLNALLALAQANEQALQSAAMGFAGAHWARRFRHLLRGNSRRGSRRNIAYHYDLGNDFFEVWLDPGMTYSAALFDESGLSLEQAQARKYRRLAEALDLQADHHVLEIGCGWGGFAVFAARNYGCRVTAITLSREQQAHAQNRVREAGLADLIEVRLQDYRDVHGRFDRIASIEMFEAVGEQHWPQFFITLRDRLAPGGIAGMQIITIAEDRFEDYRRAADFIQTYIFPGGMLPSPSVLKRQIERAGLAVTDHFTFGPSYAETLAHWRRAFDREWLCIAALGFNERFRRMWTFYLAYCEVGFRSGTIDVAQLQIRAG
ncbi:MAG: class I SAM-dependent methyltransferase [Rhodospirillales bacterium]|nr:class I SAM-dependent methyltransferase [Rhodospirillales bacterium]